MKYLEKHKLIDLPLMLKLSKLGFNDNIYNSIQTKIYYNKRNITKIEIISLRTQIKWKRLISHSTI